MGKASRTKWTRRASTFLQLTRYNKERAENYRARFNKQDKLEKALTQPARMGRR